MRWVLLAAGLLVGACAAFVISQDVLRPPPAADRLAGVSVAMAGYTIGDLPGDRHRLVLSLAVTSARDVDECVGFALDEPFANRRMTAGADGCWRPRRGTTDVPVTFDGLTDDDLAFPSHTIVWGIPGGRCGPILEALGVCVVEGAGTVALELPSHSVVPTFRPGQTLGPLIPVPSLDFTIN
jgi:hypothetical protein